MTVMGHIRIAVVAEFQRTKRMGNPFEAITLAVRKIVEWVNTPIVSGTVMVLVFDPVDDRVAKQ